jgi:undecaprenyl-diphosphatase
MRMSGIVTSFLAWDDQWCRTVNAFVGRVPEFDALVVWLSSAYSAKFGIPVAMLCWAWFQPGADRRANRTRVVGAIVAVFVALFTARALAASLPFRDRPLMRPELELTPVAGFGTDFSAWSAFPSDHAVMAFALVAGLFLVSRSLGWLATVHAVVVICLPRLYLGLHHPSDLVAGALLGVAIALAVDRSPLRRRLGGALVDVAERAPAPFGAVSFLLLLEAATMFEDVRELAGQVKDWVL